ncbi:uncharacterized protein VP01_36g2 [Puccinia sorghi]|uniref:Uncharacterized protein n=1 Tax=Puccinia sorghi TaxID=27349 RepID=A0A0L6UU59_9BASI|nr:uncharacterized protein VP01_36g2 [Puccinia sorghi]
MTLGSIRIEDRMNNGFEETIEVIDVDGEAADNKNTNKATNTTTCSQTSVKQSWVWTHFQDSPDTNVVICQHLLKNHRLVAPKLNKRIGQTQANIAKYFLNGQMAFKASFFLIFFCFLFYSIQLNSESLQTANIYFLTDTNLPFFIFERNSFKNILQLKVKFEFLSQQEFISFTQDAYSPQCHRFYGGHCPLHRLQLSNDQLNGFHPCSGITFNLGQHTGNYFANLFYHMLEEYDCLKKINTITATMLQQTVRWHKLLKLLPIFNTQNLLGCITHVINLGAKAVLAVLEPNLMSISSLKSVPDETGLDLKTILKRVHGLSSYAMAFAQPDLAKTGAKFTRLDINVSTCWNSTFHMFKQAILLQKTCTHFCREENEAAKFLFSPEEWTQQ